jgi:cytochrome c553
MSVFFNGWHLFCLLSMLISYTASAGDPEAAVRETAKALTLTPDLENGKKLYGICAVCVCPEGWGSNNGYYPQVAGQLFSVIIKQLSDIRARNRDNPTMFPFSMPSSLGGAQEMADVAAYISSLPMVPNNGKGFGTHLALGEKLYKENCTDCHGDNGEGDEKEHVPLIQGQHYHYLVRQFRWIKYGKRRNADREMVKQIRGFTGRDITAVMDYVSRLRPPQKKLAEEGWLNPHFPKHKRMPRPYAIPQDPMAGSK